MTCPHCTAVLPEEDLFCEECGKPLSSQPPLPAPLCLCGAPDGDLDDDGYCLQCGRRCRPLPGEHEEEEASPDFAAVSDRGLRHHRNEDRFAIRNGATRRVLVVCDGVSNSSRADDAAVAASSLLATALANGDDLASGFEQAQDAVAKLIREPSEVAPSACAVAARVDEQHVHIGWIGDCRAYWISHAGSRQLTNDHSWMNEVVSTGEYTQAEAAKSLHAHGVTRWIGADAGPECRADTTVFEVPGTGWLVLCSDGLWNYASETQHLAELILKFPAEASALEIARYLTSFANESGGHDNVTVALLRFPG